MLRRNILLSSGLVCFACCVMGKPHHRDSFENFDFDLCCSGADWQVGFADYRADQEPLYELAWESASESSDLNCGLLISGNNYSDDLFMFIKHPICGLEPLTTYQVEGCVQFRSKAPTGCAGAGGDPGESVFVKFGASPDEPASVVADDGMVRMNLDVGHQSNAGADAVVIGNIATTITDCHNEQYEVKELDTPAPLITRSDAGGRLWIFVGSDSGFEGKTSLIYTQVRVRIHKYGCR